MHHGEFRDPRVAAVYDIAFGWSRDDEYFVARLAEQPARDVADLGCGTGRLAIALAERGYRVTGADPAEASLSLARAKPGAAEVTWLHGSAEVLPPHSFDAVVMTSHVAQFLVTDDEFVTTLKTLHRALRPGGRLHFDSRDPADRRWEHWTRTETLRTLTLPDGTTCTTWGEADLIGAGVVACALHYSFSDGDQRVGTAEMRFRTEAELRRDLTSAGFTVDTIHGGWQGEPMGHPDGELLVTAHR